MSFKFNSDGFFKLFLTSCLLLICISFYLIYLKYGNIIGSGYNIFYIFGLMISLLITSFFNRMRKNLFLDLTNLFFLVTFITPAVFSHLDFYYTFRNVYDATILKSFPIIIYQYFVLSVSIFLINPGNNFRFKSLMISEKIIKFFLILLLIVIFINSYEPLYNRGYFDSFPGFIQIGKSVFNSYIAYLIIFYILFFKDKNVSRVYVYVSYLALLFLTVSTLLNGSRSILFSLFFLFCFFSRLQETTLNVNLRSLIIVSTMFFIAPVVFLVGSTYRRIVIDPIYWEDLSFFKIVYMNFLQYDDFIRRIIGAIFSRLSYIDFSVEKISSAALYDNLVSFNYYYKSIIDKLSPGFDLYNVPFVTRSVYWVSQLGGSPELHATSESAIMNSELIPPYAELYILFGIYSLIFTLFFYYLFKRIFFYIDGIKYKELRCFLLVLVGYYLFKYNLGMALDFYFVFLCYLMTAISLIYFLYRLYAR